MSAVQLPPTMLPLAVWPAPERARLVGVLTDIDDTLTTEGAVGDEVLQALAALADAGLHVIPITGRPVGWSEPFALAWPIDAIVAENGAVALWNDKGRLHKTYAQDAATRRQNAERLQAAAARVLAERCRVIPDPRLRFRHAEGRVERLECSA